MNSLKILKTNRWVQVTFALLLIQQALVATGTYMMGDLASSFVQKGGTLWLLVALGLCVSLPGTLFHYLVNLATALANRLTLRAYFESYVAANYNQPSQWRNESSRRERHDVVTKAGQETLLSANSFAVDLTATTLNILLNTVSVMLVTRSLLGLAILVGGGLGILVVHMADQKIAITSAEEMRAETAVNAQLARSWDNIVLGNRVHFARWNQCFEHHFQQATKAQLRSTRTRDGAVALAAFVTNLIVVGTALGLAWAHRQDKAAAAAILVMLPRSLQTTFHLQIIQSYWAQWKSLRQRLHQVDQTLTPLAPADLLPFVKPEQIQLRSACGKAAPQLPLHLPSGRYLLSGENGAGKSTMLLRWKDQLGEEAIYLPAHHQLQGPSATMSSGQTAMAFLNDLQPSDAKVILLDEWDANLSPANRAVFTEVIDALSCTNLVVEIRHSASNQP